MLPVGMVGMRGLKCRRLCRVLPRSDEEEEGPRWRGAGKGGETEAGEGSVSPGGAGHFYRLLLRGQRGQ